MEKNNKTEKSRLESDMLEQEEEEEFRHHLIAEWIDFLEQRQALGDGGPGVSNGELAEEFKNIQMRKLAETKKVANRIIKYLLDKERDRAQFGN